MNKTNYSEKEIYNLIAGIPDPEIPVITIEDLGILREVSIKDDKILISITPTYSGCPAMKAIENDIKEILSKHDIGPVEIKTVFSPPEKSSSDKNVLLNRHVYCPRCNSTNTELISQFGSTACKALYKCKDCLEPFDHFKCH